MIPVSELYHCPGCGGPIKKIEDALECEKCVNVYPLTHGIPNFIKEDRYWGNLPLEEMRRINAFIEEHGFYGIRRELVRAFVPAFIAFLMRKDYHTHEFPLRSAEALNSALTLTVSGESG